MKKEIKQERMRKVPEIAKNNAEDVQGIEPKYLQMEVNFS